MTPEAFVTKWKAAELKERAAAQSHFNDLCAMLGEPGPTDADPTGEWFAFERGASKTTGGDGWADVWKRGFFGWEYKGKRKDLNAAFAQLQQYALALENPPLLVVCDMNRFRVHTNWTNTVSQVHEFALDDLREIEPRQKLKWVLSDPERLRPNKTRQALTEGAAAEFAALAQRLRARGHAPDQVAHFVNRLIFCMFAEDVDLLPDKLFSRMLKSAKSQPDQFQHRAADLFRAMKTGGEAAWQTIAWFNGGLFNDDTALPLDKDDLTLAIKASDLDWGEIDPSILGTLFERGLDPDKRSQLGAHYTDRDKIIRHPPTESGLVSELWVSDSAACEAVADCTASPDKPRPAIPIWLRQVSWLAGRRSTRLPKPKGRSDVLGEARRSQLRGQRQNCRWRRMRLLTGFPLSLALADKEPKRRYRSSNAGSGQAAKSTSPSVHRLREARRRRSQMSVSNQFPIPAWREVRSVSEASDCDEMPLSRPDERRPPRTLNGRARAPGEMSSRMRAPVTFLRADSDLDNPGKEGETVHLMRLRRFVHGGQNLVVQGKFDAGVAPPRYAGLHRLGEIAAAAHVVRPRGAIDRGEKIFGNGDVDADRAAFRRRHGQQRCAFGRLGRGLLQSARLRNSLLTKSRRQMVFQHAFGLDAQGVETRSACFEPGKIRESGLIARSGRRDDRDIGWHGRFSFNNKMNTETHIGVGGRGAGFSRARSMPSEHWRCPRTGGGARDAPAPGRRLQPDRLETPRRGRPRRRALWRPSA